jgi:hypothetical protein
MGRDTGWQSAKWISAIIESGVVGREEKVHARQVEASTSPAMIVLH